MQFGRAGKITFAWPVSVQERHRRTAPANNLLQGIIVDTGSSRFGGGAAASRMFSIKIRVIS